MKIKLHSIAHNEDQKSKPHQNVNIHCLIKDNIEYEQLVIEPHETIIAILTSVELLDKEIGFLSVTKEFVDKGMLVIMPQLVHPGYNGCLSAIIVNFSNKPREIRKSDKILQLLVFQDVSEQAISAFPYKISLEDYVSRAKEKSKDFPSTFLLTGEVDKMLDEKIRQGYGNFFTWKAVAFFAGLIAIMAIAVSMLEYAADRRVSSYVNSYHTIDQFQTKSIDASDYEELLKRIHTLEKKLKMQD